MARTRRPWRDQTVSLTSRADLDVVSRAADYNDFLLQALGR